MNDNGMIYNVGFFVIILFMKFSAYLLYIKFKYYYKSLFYKSDLTEKKNRKNKSIFFVQVRIKYLLYNFVILIIIFIKVSQIRWNMNDIEKKYRNFFIK